MVDTILTGSATRFISPLTFQSVTGRRAYIDGDLWGSESHVLHVGLGHTADLIVIAPATANTLAKLANGLADNLPFLDALRRDGLTAIHSLEATLEDVFVQVTGRSLQ